MSYILRTHQLNKSYKGIETVSKVNMHVRKGEIYGFLGPNGAGKTTVMRMITNLVKPSSGHVELFGEALTPKSYEPFKRMGSIIEYPIFYDHLSAQANMKLHLDYMGYYDTTAIAEALELVGLTKLTNKPIKTFSLGMKQRLGIARAISTRPELLILDEPTNGMDPIGIIELRELFRMLSKEYGMTLLISSHILQEVEQIADTIGVINHGVLLEEVSMDRIRGQHSEFIEMVTTDGKHAAFVLEDKLGITNYKFIEDNTIRIYELRVGAAELTRQLIYNDVGLVSFIKKNLSLEEHFLKLIQGVGGHA
ncbi:MAG: transporter ATP-binding protein [Paenibacillus sp.]|jgi:ABC-2 type transport system ATP-binding protein|nr:transporter ATP-binding protein [Paenibacillus sp.]